KLYRFFFFSSRRRHTRSKRDWSSDVCSSDLRILRPFLVIYLCALATTVWSASGPATITQQPTNQTVLEGEQPILSVGADGTTPQIGRASCRERVVVAGRGVRVVVVRGCAGSM